MDNTQLELFSGNKNTSDGRIASRRPFWSYIRGYERFIMVVIGFIVTGIICFSIGVEKGKQTAGLLKVNSRFDTAGLQPQQRTAAVLQQKQAPAMPKEQESSNSGTDNDSNNYTIQIASYQSRAVAQREAEFLKKKGFSTIVIAKGTYTILCVGNFPNKQKANTSLVEMKKKYRDCFIRRL
ncbi:MAG: SPOR domain-containing protein [Candidatus Omnitrophica bacterium]|jgi:hypothetical protein|nr:SPOR domain-containing protein [Candidatus Omnitrophota bacterium]